MATQSEANHRSHRFAKDREPGRLNTDLQLVHDNVSGPLSAFNPTTAYLEHTGLEIRGNHSIHPSSDDGDEDGKEATVPPPPQQQQQQGQPASQVQYRWTSRNNRKGRHELIATPASQDSGAQYLVPGKTNTPAMIMKITGRMITDYPYWDISWLVAYSYTWGSIIWVINAFFSWLPLVDPSTAFPNESLYGGGITAFIGATVFEFGSILLFLEAVNENQEGCFGWAVKEVYRSHKGTEKHVLALTPDRNACTHHHVNKKNLVGGPRTPSNDEEAVPNADSQLDRHWTWCPSWSDLKSHYFHEIGFLACVAQLTGSTIFWISGFTALPGILNHLSPNLQKGIYWAPQVVGGCGFILSGILFTLETQKKWYLPALNTLGWHIGIWNLIGGIGFTVCPAFGYDSASWAQYEAGLSTFWGSWAFLIGSVIQLYESLQKHPVTVKASTGNTEGTNKRDGS